MVGAVNSGQSGSSLVTGSYAEKIGVQDSRSRELQIGDLVQFDFAGLLLGSKSGQFTGGKIKERLNA
jgi:hypothetical protein